MDFVSQYCFKLPKEEKCNNRKRFHSNLWQILVVAVQVSYWMCEFSFLVWQTIEVSFSCFFPRLFFSCSRGFTKASDLLEALKKIEEKDTAGVRKSGYGRKRGIPVRLYKRCLRLEREADVIAQLTWFYKLQCTATMNLSGFSFHTALPRFFSFFCWHNVAVGWKYSRVGTLKYCGI